MSGAMAFGLIGGLALSLMTMAAPQPTGSIIFFGVTAIYMTWGALTIWRRMRLLFISAAVLASAVMSAVMIVAALEGVRFPLLPSGWATLFYSLVAVSMILGWLDRQIHPKEWELWGRHMEHMGLRDLLMGRHIPDLRPRSN